MGISHCCCWRWRVTLNHATWQSQTSFWANKQSCVRQRSFSILKYTNLVRRDRREFVSSTNRPCGKYVAFHAFSNFFIFNAYKGYSNQIISNKRVLGFSGNVLFWGIPQPIHLGLAILDKVRRYYSLIYSTKRYCQDWRLGPFMGNNTNFVYLTLH